MRFIRMLGLVSIAALTAVAVSAVTASISQAATTLCSENVTPCPAEKVLGSGTAVTASVVAPSQVSLKAEKSNQESLPEVSCQKSELAGTITGNDGTQVLGEITKLTFGECTAGKLFSCTVESQQLPYNASDIYTAQGNGTFTVFAKAPNEQPGARVSCPIVGLNCVFKVSETNSQNGVEAGNLVVTGGNPATVTANQIVLKTCTPSGGNCLTIKVARWSATYTVSTPKPVFQSQ